MSTSPESTWLKLDPTEFQRPERTEIDGIKVHVFVSPYDVPEAVRGRYDFASKRLFVEFKYLDDEKSVEKPVDAVSTVRVGKNSGRILAIHVYVGPLEGKHVGAGSYMPKFARAFKLAIDKFSESQQIDSSRLKNYEVAEEVISERGEQLFKEVIGAK